MIRWLPEYTQIQMYFKWCAKCLTIFSEYIYGIQNHDLMQAKFLTVKMVDLFRMVAVVV